MHDERAQQVPHLVGSLHSFLHMRYWLLRCAQRWPVSRRPQLSPASSALARAVAWNKEPGVAVTPT